MKLIFTILIFASLQTAGQVIASETIDESKVNSWTPKFLMEYQGVYHFGDSEDESDLLLIFFLDKICGQIRSGSWSADGKSWIWKYENLKDIKIKGNKFTSDKSNGEFVSYGNETEKIKGLKIYKPWSEMPEVRQYEIGLRKSSSNNFLTGKFTEASFKILDEEEMAKMTKADLKLMRNEIFARYGLKFSAGGEMDQYFKKQDWYHGQYDNVDQFLTDIYKQNNTFIKQVELKKNGRQQKL
jgi:hypothetical protein